MNAANYNWTEPINRASDKPGEIHVWDVESILELHTMRKILEAGERDSLWRDGG